MSIFDSIKSALGTNSTPQSFEARKEQLFKTLDAHEDALSYLIDATGGEFADLQPGLYDGTEADDEHTKGWDLIPEGIGLFGSDDNFFGLWTNADSDLPPEQHPVVHADTEMTFEVVAANFDDAVSFLLFATESPLVQMMDEAKEEDDTDLVEQLSAVHSALKDGLSAAPWDAASVARRDAARKRFEARSTYDFDA